MAFTNSPLATVTVLSPNHSGQRTHEIDTITIHCVVGQCTAKRIGEIFLPESRQASSNYGIGYDGEIGLYVEEKNRSWCTSSRSNDQRAITIEVASDTTEPYAVTDKAYAALIDLVTDICKRNGIKELKWQGDKSLIGQVDKQNMTVHRWFANKPCPGKYLYDRHPAIAAEVNKRLGQDTKEEVKVMYRVQIGAYSKKENAEKCLAKAKAAGFTDAFIKAETVPTAEKTETETPKEPEVVLAVGDKVKMAANAPVYGKTTKFSSWVYQTLLYVREIKGSRVVVSTQATGAVTGAVDKKYLAKV